MEERAFDLKPMEEKQRIISDLGGDLLLEIYDGYRKNFNPLSEKYCETYSIIRSEINRRCHAYGEIQRILSM